VVALLNERGHEVVASGRGDTDVLAHGGFDGVVWAAGARVQDVESGLEVHARQPARILESSGASRFVYLSSGEAYGLIDVPFREDTALRGGSPYARAKIGGEQAVMDAALNFGAAAIIIRPGVVFGPGQRGQMLVPALLGALTSRRRFPMTRGDQTRDVIYVDDVARMIVRALDDDAPPGIYNAGRGIEVPVIDVVSRVVTEASDELGVDLMPLLDAGGIPYRDGEQMRHCLDISRARDLLGWQAEVDPLEVGVPKTVHAFLARQTS